MIATARQMQEKSIYGLQNPYISGRLKSSIWRNPDKPSGVVD